MTPNCTRMNMDSVIPSSCKNTTSRLAVSRTITLSSFITVSIKISRPHKRYHHTVTDTPTESRNHPPPHPSFQTTSNAKWLAEKANPLAGRQDPKKLHHISKSRTLLKLVYKSVSHFFHWSSLVAVNGERVLGASTQVRAEHLPCTHWTSLVRTRILCSGPHELPSGTRRSSPHLSCVWFYEACRLACPFFPRTSIVSYY